MALNIKNSEVEALANEVAELSGDSMTGAVLIALRERRDRLQRGKDQARRLQDVQKFLERRIWPLQKKKRRLTDDALLGYGKSGA